jgi:carboxyl-terminal processing protease
MVVRQRFLFLGASVVLIGGVVALASGAAGGVGRGMYRLMSVFGQVVSLVRSSYVEEVPLEKLELGAMNGMVTAADPGGFYIPDDVIAEYTKVRRRALPPFGLVLGQRSSYPFVLQVISGSPAEKAGIAPGELLERIGTDPVRARPLWLALTLLDAAEHRGEVKVDVIDRQLSGKRPATLKAAPFAVPALAVEMQDAVPVVRIPMLDQRSAEDLSQALRAHSGAAGLVIDLRGVALGNAEGAARVAAEIAGGDVQVQLGKKDGRDETVKASGPKRSWKLVVCLDGTTAGPGELLAVALKAGGATLVGGESYGDTGIRSPFEGAGGETWLATAWGIGLDGKPLLGVGLKPDERVRSRKGADLVLKRALELAGGHAVKQAA